MNHSPVRNIALALLPLTLLACKGEEQSAAAPEPAVQAQQPQVQPSAAPLPAEVTPQEVQPASIEPTAEQAAPAPPPVVSPEERQAIREARKEAREERRLKREQWWTDQALSDLQLTDAQITLFEQNHTALKDRLAQSDARMAELREGLSESIQGADIPSLRTSFEHISALRRDIMNERLDIAEATLQHLGTDQLAWLEANPQAMRRIMGSMLGPAAGERGLGGDERRQMRGRLKQQDGAMPMGGGPKPQ